MRSRHAVLILAATLAAVAAVAAVAAADPGSCRGPAYRAFDFWLGEWRVTGADGDVLGENVVSRVSGGCALREDWTAADGTTGTSLSYFDPGDERWHQHWVGEKGTLLHLAGGRVGEAMILTGDRETGKGTVRHRITWRPRPGGGVRQTWERSTDGGATWRTVFDGFYSRSD